MAFLSFDYANFRDRGFWVCPPFGDDPSSKQAMTVEDSGKEHRTYVLERLQNTLNKHCVSFCLEHFDDFPEGADTEEAVNNFLSAYSAMLWQFRRVRKQDKSVLKYAISIRVNAYDRVFALLKEIARLRFDRDLQGLEFEEQLIQTTLGIGGVMRELELIGDSKMNAPEFLIQRELQQMKAARNRHIENHSLRDAVYFWADENFKPGMFLDTAASQVAGKVVPLKWRTVRDHLTEWKKLRSRRTP